MKKSATFFSAIAFALFMMTSLHSFAQSKSNDDGKKVTVTGEVLDMQCYTSVGAHGASHKECGTTCIKGGAPIGLLDKDGKVTLLVKDEKSPGDFDKLKDHATDQ